MDDSVDGRNPAPVNNMVNICKYPIIYVLFQGFYASQVVQDFFHQQLRYVKIYDRILNGGELYNAYVSCTHQVFLFANHSRTDRFTPQKTTLNLKIPSLKRRNIYRPPITMGSMFFFDSFRGCGNYVLGTYPT